MGNSLGDVFYPDNPKRRVTIIKLTQQIFKFMTLNFRATNHLTNFLREQQVEDAAKFEPIYMEDNQTLEYNSKILQQRIIEVGKIIHTIDKVLEKQLDQASYQELRNIDLSLEDRSKAVEKATAIVTGATASALAVCVKIASSGILSPMIDVLGVVY